MQTPDRHFSPLFGLVMTVIGLGLMVVSQASALVSARDVRVGSGLAAELASGALPVPDSTGFPAAPGTSLPGAGDGAFHDLHYETPAGADTGVWI